MFKKVFLGVTLTSVDFCGSPVQTLYKHLGFGLFYYVLWFPRHKTMQNHSKIILKVVYRPHMSKIDEQVQTHVREIHLKSIGNLPAPKKS